MDVLIIEDEVKVSTFLERGLKENGHNVSLAFDGDIAFRLLNQREFDVIVLDLMLPGVNGFELCKQFRRKNISTPILILSALSSVDDKVKGLECGADDYLSKPFHFKELLSRLQAITRRKDRFFAKNTNLYFSDIKLDDEKKIAIRGDKKIILTAKEYTLLELFIRNNDKVLSRAFIAENVWGYEFDSNSNVIDVYVNYLRKKIDSGFQNKLLHTVVGMGYIMKEE